MQFRVAELNAGQNSTQKAPSPNQIKQGNHGWCIHSTAARLWEWKNTYIPMQKHVPSTPGNA